MPSSAYLLALDALGVCLFVYFLRSFAAKRRGLQGRSPPGPRPLPLIGNLLDMPTEHQWVTFSKWADQYGDIVSVNVLGQQIVILNRLEDAIALFEKRSGTYSDRPTMQVAGEMIGWNQSLVLSPYGERFRDIRRLLHQYIGTEKLLYKFHDIEEEESRRFLRRLLQNPSDWVQHTKKLTGAIILKMGFGYQIKDQRDELLEIVDHAVDGFIISSSPGAFLADVIPALRYIPSWVPGTEWQRKGREWNHALNQMHDVPYEYAKGRASEAAVSENFISRNLDFAAKSKAHEYHLKMAAGSLYSGGADTTVSAVSTFFLAMTLYPEVQKRAQQELDAVIGTDRLPTLADKPNLPYLRALVSEVFRWQPIAPIGVPHVSIEADVYREYVFEKGAVFIPNIMKFLHEPDVYQDPWTFKPERFLEEGGHVPEPDPRSCVFGFGRRSCPGMHLAETTVFLTCAATLAAFNIRKVVVNGKEVTPPVEYHTGTISHPKPFLCDIKPRSARAAALVSVAERA